ncbi:Oxidoreductase AflY [Madurella fahalii]|uniref:Oxidoreductase AflY n=1 Tax=Madurella fahalii TaxID=1157608 RepID=A0ABQ0GIM5_9PEZI
MGQQGSRAAFDSLLAKTHVQHALVQPGGQHNDIPAAIATLLLLDGTPSHLQTVYESEEGHLTPWTPSPRCITDQEDSSQYLGDVRASRFQRAFMTYFSMENGRFAGDSKALAVSHLFLSTKPLVYGLFSGVGRPLALLSDGIELRAAVLVVESLTLSAVDWMEPMRDLLTHSQLESPASELLSPDEVLGRVAYDGRFSGVMKAGPGFHGVTRIFSNPAARAAIVEYMQLLDCRDLTLLLQQLSALSATLLCATHKPGRPAFDFYLGRLPTCVNSTRLLLETLLEESSHRTLLVRGVWLLVMLTYITQLRPVIDPSLMATTGASNEGRGWSTIYQEFSGQNTLEGKYSDVAFLRTMRSLWELEKAYGGVHGMLYLQAALKMASQWQEWTGLGADREPVLNIRL